MSKIICKICGAEEESEKWIPETKEKVEKEQMCFRCLHWAEQHRLDLTERGGGTRMGCNQWNSLCFVPTYGFKLATWYGWS